MSEKLKEIEQHIKSRKEHLQPLFDVTLSIRNKAMADKDEIALQITNADKRTFEAYFFELNEIQKILDKK